MRSALVLTVLLLASALAGCASEKKSTGGAVEARECVQSGTNPIWKLDTTMGTICVELFNDKTPITSGNFINLTKSGHFDGTRFHRVIESFMNQGGDPLSKDDSKASSWGTGSTASILDEFPCKDGRTIVGSAPPANCDLLFAHDEPGMLSMANRGPNTGSCQFFLTAVATPHLDGKHAVFGQTADAKSLDVVLAINKVETGARDRPLKDVTIVKATIVGA